MYLNNRQTVVLTKNVVRGETDDRTTCHEIPSLFTTVIDGGRGLDKGSNRGPTLTSPSARRLVEEILVSLLFFPFRTGCFLQVYVFVLVYTLGWCKWGTFGSRSPTSAPRVGCGSRPHLRKIFPTRKKIVPVVSRFSQQGEGRTRKDKNPTALGRSHLK